MPRLLGHPATPALINERAAAASRSDGDELLVFRAAGG